MKLYTTSGNVGMQPSVTDREPHASQPPRPLHVGADDTLPSYIVLLKQSAYLGGTRRARPMLRTSIEIHEPERERPNWAAEGWSDGENEEDKSHGVEKHWPASPHEGKTTELHELKLVAVYDARRVGHRDKCRRNIHTLPG